MQREILRELRSRLPHIRSRWETLLEDSVSALPMPLTNRRSLLLMIEWTSDAILADCATSRAGPHDDHRAVYPYCQRAQSPLAGYFAAGERAFTEAILVAQVSISTAESPDQETALEEFRRIYATIALREAGAFCAVCTHSGAQSWCDHPGSTHAVVDNSASAQAT